MSSHASSTSIKGRRHYAAHVAACLLLAALAGCAGQPAGALPVPARGGAEPAASSESRAPGLYAVDALVRARELDSIDLHVRYVDWTPARLVVHLALYNNGPTDLLQVQGVVPSAARLVGAGTYAPTAQSASLAGGLVPEGGWYSGGAVNGTLTFPAVSGTAFTFVFPGFPPVPFRLDLPLRAAPEPAPAAPGTYGDQWEVRSTDVAGRVLRIEGVTVTADALELDVALMPEADNLALAAAVLFDARWNQYHPAPLESAALDEPGAEDASGTRLRFPRPLGQTVLLKVPSFPLVRIPLRAGDEPAAASAADLPPAYAPRADIPGLAGIAPETTDGSHLTIEGLLRDLNARFAAGDRAGYLEAFAPEAQPEQAAIFDRLSTLPLADVTLEPGSGNDPVSETADVLHDYRALWSYRVQDVDAENIFRAEVALDLRRDPDGWRIVRIGGDLPFWALGPAAARRAGPFWIFHRPAAEPELAAIGGEAQAALARIDERLPGRIAGAHVLFVADTAEEFGRLTGRDATRFLGAAVSRWEAGADGVTISGAAFYLNGAAFQARPDQDRQQTIAHELTHLVLAPRTMPWSPLWVVEGMAMEVADDLPDAAMRTAYATGAVDTWSIEAFTAARSFGAMDPHGLQTAVDYAFSAYLVRYLVRTYGFERCLQFYDSFADVPFDEISAEFPPDGAAPSDAALGRLAQQLTPERLRLAFGVDLPALESQFKAWLDAELR